MAAALLALLPAAVSCSGTGTDDLAIVPELGFKRNPEKQEGGTQFLTVTASASWTISITFNGEQVDWVGFRNGAERSATVSGEGSTSSVALTCDPNPAAASRKAILTIRSGSKMSNVTFVQSGTDPGATVDESDDPETPGTPAMTAGGWLELPQTDLGDGYAFFTHYMTVTGVRKRNYSFYWSKSDCVSIWVAYPMNGSLIGSGSRPNPEPWAMDPLLQKAGIRQPDLSEPYSNSGIYGRGHQIASADRYVGDGNAQTYYASNMTPQLHEFNGGIWASLEMRMRDWSRMAGADTCYVVTGCMVKGSSQKSSSRVNGVSSTVPVGYYKAILRHARTATVGYGGFSGLAIWLDHKDYGSVTLGKDMFCSIDDLEKKIGIDLFANLPDQVGQNLADKIEAEDPKKPVASLNLWW